MSDKPTSEPSSGVQPVADAEAQNPNGQGRHLREQAACPWQRRKGESRKAYAAFLAYRDLGPDRSLSRVAEALGKQLSLMKRWSAKHEWVWRAEAWDQARRVEADETSRRAREAAYERRLASAEQLERVAMAGLRSLMVRDPHTGEARFDPRLKPGDIASLIRVAAQILPTPVPAASASGEEAPPEALTRLRDEDIRLLLSLLEDGGKEKEDNG